MTGKHWTDECGRADGGVASGDGFCIAWRRGEHGATVAGVLAAALDRIGHYVMSEHADGGRVQAMEHIQTAMDIMREDGDL